MVEALPKGQIVGATGGEGGPNKSGQHLEEDRSMAKMTSDCSCNVSRHGESPAFTVTRAMESTACLDALQTASQDLPNVPYAKFASMLGLKGIYVDHPDDLEAAWLDALAADRPVVLEVKTDANVPPLPPHITPEQAKAFLAAFMKGDRPLAGVMVRTLKRAIHETA